jgi:hypothetical protein
MEYSTKAKSLINRYLNHIMMLVVLGFIFLFPGAYSEARVASYSYNPADTIPKVKLYQVKYDLVTWQRKFDTLTYTQSIIGKSLTVDNAEVVKTFMQNFMSDMAGQIQKQLVADTVKKK